MNAGLAAEQQDWQLRGNAMQELAGNTAMYVYCEQMYFVG